MAGGPPSVSSTPTPQQPASEPVKYYQYPLNLGNAGSGQIQGSDNWISFEAKNFKSQLPTLNIALYIPGGALNTSYKSDYDTTSLGALGASGENVLSALRDVDGIDYAKLLTTITAGASGAASEAAKVSMLKGGERANVAIEGTKAMMERSEGAVLNPFLVASYKGPSDMRTHDFDFQMLPQSEKESEVCMKIVNEFKKAMLPSHAGGDSQTAPSMLFGYPDTFTITFYVNGNPLPKQNNPMFSVGKSVLTGCELNFDTENVPLFFDNTQNPVSISMKLSFMELEVLYREKIDQGF